jgi:hypothetical protein
VVKVALLGLSAAWSIVLGHRLLGAQGISPPRRWLPLIPGAAGSLAVGAAWYPAVLGA